MQTSLKRMNITTRSWMPSKSRRMLQPYAQPTAFFDSLAHQADHKSGFRLLWPPLERLQRCRSSRLKTAYTTKLQQARRRLSASSVEQTMVFAGQLGHGGSRMRNMPREQASLPEVAMNTSVESTAVLQRLTKGLHTSLEECGVSRAAQCLLCTHSYSVH